MMTEPSAKDDHDSLNPAGRRRGGGGGGEGGGGYKSIWLDRQTCGGRTDDGVNITVEQEQLRGEAS